MSVANDFSFRLFIGQFLIGTSTEPMWMGVVSEAKVFPGFTLMQVQAARRFYKKSSDTLRALRISRKKLAWANPYLLKLLKQLPSTPAPLRHKKKVIDHEKQERKNILEPATLQPSIQHSFSKSTL